MLELIDKYLGLLYVNMVKIVSDSGDFIQGFKKMIVKELSAVIELMFNMGIKLCIAFIVLDVILHLIDMPYNKISIYSKILALFGILFFKYNVINQVKKLVNKNNSEKI